MMDEPQEKPDYPHDKEELLRDLTLVGRLKDIRDQEQLRERLAPRWWEPLIAVLQFAGALGLLASLMQHPALRTDPYWWLAIFWGGLMIVSLVLGLEFLIFRMQTLRRANEILVRQVEDLNQRIGELEKEQGHSDGEAHPTKVE